MKKYWLFTFLIFAFIADIIAQPRIADVRKKKNKIHIEKVEYLSAKLQLTEKKETKFRKLYNEQFAKLKELHKKEKELRKKLHQLDILKEDEIQKIADKIVKLRTRKTLLKEEYHHKFKKILTAREQVLLHQAEREFRKLLFKKIKNKPHPPPQHKQ